MKNKLILALLLVLALTFSVLVACEKIPEEPTQYTVMFAGEGVNVASQKVNSGSCAVEPKDPEREGYTFKYWYLTDDSQAYDFATPVTGDITLNAYWQKIETPQPTQYTVTFAGESVSVASQTVNSGSCAVEPKDPVREGYTFKYWYLTDDSKAYDFTTPVTGDITLNAYWQSNGDTPNPPTPSEMSGQGTAADPYVLYSAAHLATIATKVNGGDEAYVDAYYKLGADIDLKGIAYTSIGTLEHPFQGVFDGNGKTVSNLTIQPRTITSGGSRHYGLFGITLMSSISNVNIANAYISVECTHGSTETNIYIGAVVGYAALTNLSNISVDGEIATFFMSTNNARIGGIAGALVNSSDEQAYISYVENCFVDIQMSIGADGYEHGSLENGAVGGLFGVISNDNCAAAVINCAVYGNVYGGLYTGGIVGNINGLTSILDCYNAASVETTAEERSYAGGIVGGAVGDNIIMGCVSTGAVKAPKAAANTHNYQSYAGGIAGYAESDDYESYFTAGSSVVNCYYTVEATTADVITKLGTKYADGYFNVIDKFVKRVNWTEACWTSVSGVIRPSDKTAAVVATDGKYVLTLQNGTSEQRLDKSVESNSGYSLVGVIDELESVSNNLFWSWEITSGVQYKYYMPVIKNVTITAKWQDISDIVGAYKGTGTLHESSDAGSIILYEDGSLQWITDTIIGGEYKYDGEHILLEIYNNIGNVTGTLIDGNLVFYVDAGMTGTVTYDMNRYNPKIIGEYISDSGNLLTFTGDNRVSYESENVNNGAFVSGTYEYSGNTLTPSFSKLTGITAGDITIIDNNTIEFHFTQGGEAKTETFTKIRSVDYSDKLFIGEYYYVWASSSIFMENRGFRFTADGVAVMISPYSETIGRYYYIESTGVLKTFVEGHLSSFRFDAAENVIYGILSRGGTTVRPIVMSKANRGEQTAYTNFGSEYKDSKDDTVFIFKVADGVSYLYLNGTYQGKRTDSQSVADGATVQVGDYMYRIYNEELRLVGADAGVYTYGDYQITLDGVNEAIITGADEGSYYYRTHSDKIVTVVLDTKVIVFNYEQAQANGNVATDASVDSCQGVWFNAKGDNPYYQKLVFDGCGHVTIFYMPQDSSEYRLNWGASGWGTYQATSYGALVYFNANNKDIRFIFYYDGNFAYTADSFGGSSNYVFITKGYTGSTTPPTFPADKAGSYVSGTGSDQIVINLRADLSGTYVGNPIYNVVYDGENKVFFTANGLNYEFVLTQSGGTLKQTGDISGNTIEFTLSNDVIEIIPSALCGLWTGKFEGYGTSGENVNRGFGIESDGTVYYYSNVQNDFKTQVSNVVYDYATATLTFTDASDFNWTLVYNVESKEIRAEGKNSENTTITAILSKSA